MKLKIYQKCKHFLQCVHYTLCFLDGVYSSVYFGESKCSIYFAATVYTSYWKHCCCIQLAQTCMLFLILSLFIHLCILSTEFTSISSFESIMLILLTYVISETTFLRNMKRQILQHSAIKLNEIHGLMIHIMKPSHTVGLYLFKNYILKLFMAKYSCCYGVKWIMTIIHFFTMPY